MAKDKTLWQKLKPEHKQEIKDFKARMLIATLKKNHFWVDLRYIDGMNINKICKTTFLGDVFIQNK